MNGYKNFLDGHSKYLRYLLVLSRRKVRSRGRVGWIAAALIALVAFFTSVPANADIGASLVTSITSGTDASSYSFPSATYSDNVLYIAFTSTACASGVDCGVGTSVAPKVTSVSGAGLTFTEIGTSGGQTFSTSARRIQAWRALDTGASTGAVTVTMETGTYSSSMGAVMIEFTGTKTSGSNGADAVVQWPSVDGGSVASLTLTMNAFADSNNRPVAFFSHRAGSTPEEATHDTAEGYTELHDAYHTSVQMVDMAEWHATAANTTPSASWIDARATGAFALEIAAAGSVNPCGTNLVMVTVDGTTNGGFDDSSKRSLFESWGWTVTAIDDNATQATFDNAAANNDVMFISESTDSTVALTKARDLDIGIVVEESWLWDEMNFATSGDSTTSATAIYISDNSHYITSPFTTGSLVIYTSSNLVGFSPVSLASGGQVLATTAGNPTLFVFNTGAALTTGTAANRRVGFPTSESYPSAWNADLKTLLQRSLDWAAGCGAAAANPCGTNLVMVTGDGTTTTDADDTAKKALFESWGWTVTAIEDLNGDYSGAASSNDVMFISESATSSDVGTQATNLNIGIMVEEAALQDEMELCGPQNYTSGTTGTQIDIVDSTHYIASTFSNGALTIYSSTDSLIINQATPAPGAIVVAEGIGGNNTALVAIPTGATLDNGAGAANRRVGFTAMHESTPGNWTSSMETLVARSLEWAAGCGADGGGTNSDPVLNSIGNKSVDEGQLLEFTISATDPDTGDTLTYSASNLPTGATFTPATQTFSWTPNVGDAGTYLNVLFTVQDDATPQGSDSEGITITVNSSGGGGVGIPITAGDVADYSCNLKITIDNTKVAFTSPQNFPVLISLTDDSLKTSGCGFMTDPDGDDLVFTNSNLTLQLYHEIEKYDATTGELVAWVLVPSLSGTADTDIYMYFGNSNVTSPTENPTDVWDSNYKGVWHLKEDAATGGTGTYHDWISFNEDDSEEYISSGSLDWGSSDLELGEEGSPQIVGMRWRNVTIPQGATITSAYIEFTADEDQIGTPVNLTFWGEDVDNAAVFENINGNISSKYDNRTSASVSWPNVGAWYTTNTYLSPDISSVIQEIVNRGGWTSGNAMVVLVTGSGRRTAESYEGDGTPALLHVEYSTGDLHLDSTSNDNDGIPNGNTYMASGKIGGAQDFDGSNDYILVPDSPSFDIYANLTVEAWIWPDDAVGWETIVSKMNGMTEDLYFVLDSGNLYVGLNGVQSDWDTDKYVSAGSWQHVALTYDGSNIRVYRGGSQVDSLAASGTLNLGSNSHPLYIGYNEGWTNELWNGKIDEVRISNTARSAAWIQTSYNNQNSPSSFYSVEKNCPGTIPPISEFTCSIPITILSSKVSGTSDLINFPVLISLTDIGLKTTSNCGYVQNSSGYDIIFSNATQTTILNHEIEKYDGTSGELVAWVRIPTLSATSDTTIYLHFGHSSVCGATENPKGVWDSNYVGVWHLKETPGTDVYAYDSTANDHDLTIRAEVTSGDQVSGKIGGAIDFDDAGYTDRLRVGDDPSFGGMSGLTVETWLKLSPVPPQTGDNSESYYMSYKDHSVDPWFAWQFMAPSWDPGFYLEVHTDAGSGQGSVHGYTAASANTWYHVVGVYQSGQPLKLYVNGVDDSKWPDTPSGNILDTDSYFNLGMNMDGVLDEFRVSNTARSADWIQTEYNNQSDPSSFYSVGANSCFFLSGFSCNRKITIDSSKVESTSDLTNFPVLIKIDKDCNIKTAANGGSVKNSSGWDIVFADSDGLTQLDHEIEEYDGNSGDLTAWVKIPTLPYNSDKDIYMYYGKSGLACDPSNPAGVWSNSYRGVWHLHDTSGDTQDSTSYNTDGALSGTVTRTATGEMDNAFDVGYEGLVNWGNPGDGHLNAGTGSWTVSLWTNIDYNRGSGQWEKIINKGKNSWQAGYEMELDDTANNLYFSINDGSYSEWGRSAVLSFTDDTWMYLVGVVDRSSGLIRLYKDGDQVNTTSLSTIGNIDVDDSLTIGKGTWGYPYARFEEVRVSNAARSAGWIKTEYNNQNDPASFYSMSQDTCGGSYGFNYQYCKKITVDRTQVVQASNANFPLLINLQNYDDLKTEENGGRVGNDNGWDIVFKTSNCLTLDHEIDYYDGTTGTLVAWVRIPDLTNTEDYEVYMYYGDSNVICSPENPDDLWDPSIYEAVYHLSDDYKDSTSNNHDGTNYGTTFTAGQIGRGALFTPSNGWDHIDLGSWNVNDDDLVIQAWAWPNDFNQDDPRIVSKCATWGSGDQEHVFMLSLNDGDNGENRMRFRVKTGTNDAAGTVVLYGNSPNGYLPSAQQWYLLTGSYFNTTDQMKLWRNSTGDATVWQDGWLRQNSWPVWIGASPYGSSNSLYTWDGVLDEVRIISQPRSAGWITTEYRNQNDPGNFYTVGSCFEQTSEVTQEWVEEVQ